MGKTSKSNFVDSHVGARLKAIRKLIGLSQKDLANGVGVRFQQVQKYESGFNRIPASRLFQISQVVGRPVEWFFKGLDSSGHSTKADESDITILRPIEQETVLALRTLPEDCQNQVINLVRVLAKCTPTESRGIGGSE